MIDCVAIVSGGMDSVTLLHYLVKKDHRHPAVISFIYGQKHAREISFAERNAQLLKCEDHLMLDLTLLKSLFATSALVSDDVHIPKIEDVRGDPQPATYVPNRNMIFLGLAAAFAESHGVTEVFYGAQRHDMYGYWDTTLEFLEKVNQVYGLNRKNAVQIKAPFVERSKSDIVRMGLDLGVDYSLTWSCYQGQDLACGTCPTCAERLEAFKQAGIHDPLPYAD
jgi:7-cyano-7-deazaguanine synthase